MSFLAFCAVSVVIDVESLVNLRRQTYPVRAFLHTYVGATLAIAALCIAWIAFRRLAERTRLPDLFGWRALTFRSVVLGAALGGWTHVLLDSVMHADIAPLAPFSSSNPLLGAVSLTTLHLSCVMLGLLGLGGLGMRRLVAHEREKAASSR